MGGRVSSFRFIAAAVSALALAGCTSPETPRVKRAVADFNRAYRAKDVRTYCRKSIANTDIPPSLAQKMRIPSGKPGSPRGWDREHRDCLRTFGKHGEFDAEVGRWEVKDIEFGPRDERAGLTRTAHVQIADGDKRARVWFVKFRGDWKFVVIVS
jgi:hypothetical protein